MFRLYFLVRRCTGCATACVLYNLGYTLLYTKLTSLFTIYENNERINGACVCTKSTLSWRTMRFGASHFFYTPSVCVRGMFTRSNKVQVWCTLALPGSFGPRRSITRPMKKVQRTCLPTAMREIQKWWFSLMCVCVCVCVCVLWVLMRANVPFNPGLAPERG